MGFIKKRKNTTAVLFFSIIILFLIVSIPLIAYADFFSPPSFESITPCGRSSGTAEEMAPCNECHLFIALPQRLLEYAIYLSTFLMILSLIISGGMFVVSSTSTELRSRGRNILKKGVTGFLFVLGAYFIINSIFWVLGREKSPLENNWGQYSCGAIDLAIETPPVVIIPKPSEPTGQCAIKKLKSLEIQCQKGSSDFVVLSTPTNKNISLFGDIPNAHKLKALATFDCIDNEKKITEITEDVTESAKWSTTDKKIADFLSNNYRSLIIAASNGTTSVIANYSEGEETQEDNINIFVDSCPIKTAKINNSCMVCGEEHSPSVITKKVMSINFNPTMSSGKKLNEKYGWGDSKILQSQFINDILTASNGRTVYQIVENREIDAFPMKIDGFYYDAKTYENCWNNNINCHKPDTVDYQKILSNNRVCEKLNKGEIDELWLWGGPWFGYWEANMAGPNAFFTNGPPITTSSCQKQLNIMGFNYERGIPEMLENFGHRTEGVMNQVFSGNSPWSLFTNYISIPPQKIAGCGSVHYAPNSIRDYDWENKKIVESNCEDWLNYPNLTGQTQNFNCDRWGCTAYGYKKWWLSHLPNNDDGKTNDKWNNWWYYILDYEEALK